MPRPKKLLPYHAGGRTSAPGDSHAGRPWKIRKSSAAAKVFDSIEAAIGGRDAVVGALAAADLTDEQRYLFAVIADPRNDARSLAQLCARSGYTLGALLQVFKDAKLAKAQIEAIVKVAEELPGVASDAMTLARIRRETCPGCRGTGRFTPRITPKPKNGEEPEEQECAACDGAGEITTIPSVERQKLALEIGGLHRRDGGGVQVGVQVNGSPAPPALGGRITPDYLRDMRMGTDRLLYPGRDRTLSADTSDVVDVEAVEAVETAPTAAPVPQETEAKQLLLDRSTRSDRSARSTRSDLVPNQPSQPSQPFLTPPGKRPL